MRNTQANDDLPGPLAFEEMILAMDIWRSASDLGEVAEFLTVCAEELRRMAGDGVVLVDGDVEGLKLGTSDPAVAERWGLRVESGLNVVWPEC